MSQLPALATQHARLAALLAGTGVPLPDLPEGLTGDLLVLHPRVVATADLVPLLRLGDAPGFVVEDLTDLADFTPAPGVDLPHTDLYAVLDPQRGDEFANQSPDEADPRLRAAGRDLMTVGEGVCWGLQQPDVIERNHCFMTTGSRRPKGRGLDARTPALWISNGTGRDGKARRGAPKLGWCWAGNRHTWLGIASVAGRSTA
jgi:hypothetical protein